MRIETELKYDFDDVLIRPKRSTLSSRKEVDLTRTFRFKYGGSYRGIPVMAANMDGVGGEARLRDIFTQCDTGQAGRLKA